MALGFHIGDINENSGGTVPIGTVFNFSYTGAPQTWVCEQKGLYKLEVYGGGNGTAKGGYSLGYKVFGVGSSVSVVCGGRGISSTNIASGGYNGGGSCQLNNNNGTSGAGATHMALVGGTLESIGYATFVTNKKGLIVAGGAGGYYYSDANGAGGGATGGNGNGATGGTQTGGGTGSRTGSFGKGADYNTTYSSGGGGGFYGGGAGTTGKSGGGGSGWIGGVPSITYKTATYEPMTQQGSGPTGNGYARITRVA